MEIEWDSETAERTIINLTKWLDEGAVDRLSNHFAVMQMVNGAKPGSLQAILGGQIQQGGYLAGASPPTAMYVTVGRGGAGSGGGGGSAAAASWKGTRSGKTPTAWVKVVTGLKPHTQAALLNNQPVQDGLLAFEGRLIGPDFIEAAVEQRFPVVVKWNAAPSGDCWYLLTLDEGVAPVTLDFNGEAREFQETAVFGGVPLDVLAPKVHEWLLTTTAGTYNKKWEKGVTEDW